MRAVSKFEKGDGVKSDSAINNDVRDDCATGNGENAIVQQAMVRWYKNGIVQQAMVRLYEMGLYNRRWCKWCKKLLQQVCFQFPLFILHLALNLSALIDWLSFSDTNVTLYTHYNMQDYQAFNIIYVYLIYIIIVHKLVSG